MNNYRSPWMDEELDILRETCVRFVEAEMVPHDEEWRRQKYVSPEVWKQVGEMGLLCMDVPAEYGGMGADFRYESVFIEELSRRGLIGFGNHVHSICAHYILNHGTEEQKHRFVPRLASGELIGAIAMTEPSAGSDLKGIRTRAERDGDHYVVNGSKIFISNGYIGGVIALVVKTNPAQGAEGTSILLVEPSDLEGFKVGRILEKAGMKAQDTCELFFDDMRVPVANLLGGEEGRGFYQLMSDLPYERTITSIWGVAAMEGALEITLEYVKERKAFGKSIFDFQTTRHKLAELVTEAHIARVFVDRCIEQVCKGGLSTEEASMAKYWITDLQQKVTDGCLQLHGGYGYMDEYLISRLFVDSRVQRIYAGTNEIMKEIISRSL